MTNLKQTAKKTTGKRVVCEGGITEKCVRGEALFSGTI